MRVGFFIGTALGTLLAKDLPTLEGPLKYMAIPISGLALASAFVLPKEVRKEDLSGTIGEIIGPIIHSETFQQFLAGLGASLGVLLLVKHFIPEVSKEIKIDKLFDVYVVKLWHKELLGIDVRALLVTVTPSLVLALLGGKR